MKKILIGEISSYKAIVISKYIKKYYSDIELYCYDYNRKVKLFHTKYCDEFLVVPSPKDDLNGHFDALQKIIEDKEIDLFIPVHSDMYGVYIKKKQIFGNTFAYLGDFEQFDYLHDKEKLNSLLTRLNIKRPQVFSSYEAAKIPFIFKPTKMSSAKGVEYILGEKDRERYRPLYNQDLIIQEYVEGIGCGYSVFAKDGDILVGFGHKRLAEHPVTGGSSVYRDSYFDERTRILVQKILREAKWSGFAMFEFKLTSDGEIYVIEVNPRIWGSINQGLQNGFNYFESILGKSTFKTNMNVQYKTYLSPLIYKSFLGYLAKWNVSPILQFIKHFRFNRADVSFIDDPKGYLSMIARKF
jgi:predicted ATP-grasp superfamily ATP-dependent carboligase